MAAQLNEISAVPMMRFQTSLGGLLHDHDLRWAYPDAAQVAAAKLQDLQGLIAPALAQAPIEVTIVGDVSVEQAIALVAATFGALPSRADAPRPSAQTHFPAATPAPVVLRHAGAPDQGVAAVAWPTTDAFTGLGQSAARLLLADVMQQRLFDAVRVKAGTSYTTQATSQASTTFPGFGIVLAFADIPPGKASVFYDAVGTIVADLKAHGPTADELERARNPAIAKATQSRQTNAYWLGIVSQVQSEPRYAELARRLLPNLEAATIADVQRAAQDYLVDAREWRLLVEPDATR
jgi:zinc protease